MPPQPDPDHMIRFCREVLPDMLVQACRVEASEASAVGEDVLARATAFAALPQRAQDVLIAPFAEEVFDHEPNTSPLELLAAARREPVALTGPDPFENLAHTYPRAWACLEALAETVAHDSGRQEYQAPNTTDMPSLPQPHEIVPARRAERIDGGTLFDSVDPRFDEEFMRQLRTAIDPDGDEPKVFFVSALSRFSRNSHKQLRVMELLLAHEVTIVTTNYMLRPHDIWVRRGTLIKPDSHKPFAGLHRLQGLTGAHRHTVRQLLHMSQTV
jgi:hypothetical protein